MRRARHRPLSIPLIAFALALCAAALALPPKAEAAIRLGSTTTVSLTNGLVGYWPLDGATTNWATNTLYDISGFGNNASSTALATSTAPVAGKIGQALAFSSQRMQVR
jgi:hypothetical protein